MRARLLFSAHAGLYLILGMSVCAFRVVYLSKRGPLVITDTQETETGHFI